MSQREVRLVTCDSFSNHGGKPNSVELDEDGRMPKGWRHFTLVSGEDAIPLVFDACSPGCAALIATNYIRREVYGMEE